MGYRSRVHFLYTDGNKTLHTLLLKYYNDLLDRQSSLRGRDEVTYVQMLETLFCIYIGTKYANFQEKIFAEISGKKFQTFHCTLLHPFPLRRLSTKQVIVVLY